LKSFIKIKRKNENIGIQVNDELFEFIKRDKYKNSLNLPDNSSLAIQRTQYEVY
jgi:hypothetical protein